jgi:type II secretory pathway pseudopilin PulG
MEGSVPHNNLNNARGFSFIEVLTAVVLFSFLVVGVLMMTTMNIKSNSYTQHHTKAVQLAESGLELLRRVDYNNELPNYDGVSALSVSDFGTIPQYPDFRRVLLVNWGTQLSTLQVSVTWRTQSATSFPLVLTTQRVAP